MKPLVIYHANCADGFGAAYAAYTVLGDEAEYVPMQYLDSKLPPIEAWEAFSAAIPSKANTGREIYILDFSLPKPVMNKLLAVSGRVVWLDHHKTAFEMWCHGDFKKGDRFIDHARPHEKFILLDDNKSGAVLAWEHFHPGGKVPDFIKLLDDYDRWQFKLNGSKAFQKNLWSLAPWSFRQWDEMYLDFSLASCNYDALRDFIGEGRAILRAHDQNVQSVLAGQMECKIHKGMSYGGPESFYGLACNTPSHLCSDVGHELAKKSGTFGLCWSMQSDGRIKCELRSDSDFDVSAIAKAFGGGGHARAAGFFTDLETLKGWLK